VLHLSLTGGNGFGRNTLMTTLMIISILAAITSLTSKYGCLFPLKRFTQLNYLCFPYLLDAHDECMRFSSSVLASSRLELWRQECALFLEWKTDALLQPASLGWGAGLPVECGQMHMMQLFMERERMHEVRMALVKAREANIRSNS
jgi:hypothetical protein